MILLVGVAFAPRAQDGIFFMTLPVNTIPTDVGANAFAVVGGFDRGGGLTWMPTSGATRIGGSQANAVSLDGKTVLGRAFDSNQKENAAIWQGGRDWRLLGSIRPGAEPCDLLLSGTFGASDDGKVVVGLAWDSCRIARAFRWEESTGMIDLGTTTANHTRANEVSGDGRVVVGWQESDVGYRQGAKWIDRQQTIIRNAAGRVVGEAHAANVDGSIIVGRHCDPFNPNPTQADTQAAWKWTAQAGVRCYPVTRPPTMPNRPYDTVMNDTSNDGRVIGGAYSFGLDSESLVWIDDEVFFLQDYLRANGVPDAFRGWINSGFVTGVSPDGRTLVGYGAARTGFQGFLVILPERR